MKTTHGHGTPTMPQRSYSYARISTAGDQAEGDGLRRQQGAEGDDREPWPVKVSREQGWTLDDTLTFTDTGKSGFHSHNLKPTAALTRFLDLVKRRRIAAGSVLIIEQIDRLSRAAVDEAYDLFRGILKAGVWICTKIPFRVYRPGADSSFMDIMEPLWIMYVAWMESVKKSERAAAAWESARKKAREGKVPLPGKCPFWVRQTDHGHELDLFATAAVIRAHELCRSGRGVCLIRAALEAEGFPSPAEYRRRAGETVRIVTPWTEATVQWLLSSRAPLGEYQPCQRPEGKLTAIGDPIKHYYPPVPGIDETSWRASQAAIQGRKARRGRPGKHVCNIVLGLAHDAVSRKRLVIRSKGRGPGKRQEKYPYLTSHNVGGLRVPYEPFEECLLETLAMIRPCDVVDSPAGASERDRNIALLTREVVELEELKQRYKKKASDLSALGRDSGDILDVIIDVGEKHKAKAKELECLKLESLTGRTESLGECQQLAELVSQAEGEEKRQLQERIRGALPCVVAGIWMQAQQLSVRSHIIHIQIWLHSGQCRNVQLLPKNLRGVRRWQLDGVDLRREPYYPTGDIGHTATLAETA